MRSVYFFLFCDETDKINLLPVFYWKTKYMATIERIIIGDESYTRIKLKNVAEEIAASKLARTLEDETSNRDSAKMHGLGLIHQINVDSDAGEVTSVAFDTSMGEGIQPHALDGTYAQEILFSIEIAAFSIEQKMNGK